MRNSPWDFLFSSVGRTSRVAFIVSGAVVVAAWTAYLALVPRGLPRLATLWFAGPILLHMSASVLAQRLHDRGRSGWWAALVLAAAGWIAAFHLPLLRAPALVVLAAAFVDLGLLPGRAGANAYGLNPARRNGARRVRPDATGQTVR